MLRLKFKKYGGDIRSEKFYWSILRKNIWIYKKVWVRRGQIPYLNTAVISTKNNLLSPKEEFCLSSKGSSSTPISKITKRKRKMNLRNKWTQQSTDIMTLSIFMLKIVRIFIVMRRKILTKGHIFPLWRLLRSILTVGRVQDNSLSPETNWVDPGSHKLRQLLKRMKNLLLHPTILHKVSNSWWIWQKLKRRGRRRERNQA